MVGRGRSTYREGFRHGSRVPSYECCGNVPIMDYASSFWPKNHLQLGSTFTDGPATARGCSRLRTTIHNRIRCDLGAGFTDTSLELLLRPDDRTSRLCYFVRNISHSSSRKNYRIRDGCSGVYRNRHDCGCPIYDKSRSGESAREDRILLCWFGGLVLRLVVLQDT